MRFAPVLAACLLAGCGAGTSEEPVSTITYHNMPGTEELGLPFSSAVQVDDMLYLSGNLGNVPGTLELAEGGIEAETRQTMDNIRTTLEAHGLELRHLVKCLVNQSDEAASWARAHAADVLRITESIAGAALSTESRDFLRVSDTERRGFGGVRRERGDNVFLYPPKDPKVRIRVGSIHSVKGQTHTATLVLETFHRTHNLKALKGWLLGKRAGGGGCSNVTLGRLRQHYVAMTRPSHLLCLGMRRDSFLGREIRQLAGTGWRVAEVRDDGYRWL